MSAISSCLHACNYKYLPLSAILSLVTVYNLFLLSELLSKQIKLTHISKPKPTQTKPSNIAPRSKSAKPVNLLFYFFVGHPPHTSFYNCAVLEFSKFTPPITSFFQNFQHKFNPQNFQEEHITIVIFYTELVLVIFLFCYKKDTKEN